MESFKFNKLFYKHVLKLASYYYYYYYYGI
jgi:hypothetical protein